MIFIFEVVKGVWDGSLVALALKATKRLGMCLYVRVRKSLGAIRISGAGYVAVCRREILI